MKVLIAPDKFKGSLTAGEAAAAMARGVRLAWPRAQITVLPISDGGEGFVEILQRARRGKLIRIGTVDPMGRPCRAAFAELPDKTAVVGLTEASGLWRVPNVRRDPGILTTLGTGRVLAEVVRRGYERIIIGLGGSATNDGGIGLVEPLGFRFLDAHGHAIPLNGEGLQGLAAIERPRFLPDIQWTVATDVRNPLYGPNGAAACFAKQKGANAAQVARLDANLRTLARVAKKYLGHSLHAGIGAGAAGGCGYGLLTFLGAKRRSGFDVFADAANLEPLIRSHDLVITGEGCFDTTSLEGKGPASIAALARRYKKPVWGICGRFRLAQSRRPFTFSAEIMSRAKSIEDAVASAGDHVAVLAEGLARGNRLSGR